MQTTKLNFKPDATKKEVFEKVGSWLESLKLNIAGSDDRRPWGGYFVIEESQSDDFIHTFFPHLSPADFEGFRKLSPKILLVAPGKRLSWQYHHRRSEIWKVAGGTVGVAISETNEEKPVRTFQTGDVIEIEKGERHRLVGTGQWGVIAEIWKHTDPANPSDEDDIVRLRDDFGR